jgi:hypothetical protein
MALIQYLHDSIDNPPKPREIATPTAKALLREILLEAQPSDDLHTAIDAFTHPG